MANKPMTAASMLRRAAYSGIPAFIPDSLEAHGGLHANLDSTDCRNTGRISPTDTQPATHQKRISPQLGRKR